MASAFLLEVSEGMASIMHVKTMKLRDTTFKQLCSKTAQVLGGMGMSESSRKETMPSNVVKGWCLSGE